MITRESSTIKMGSAMKNAWKYLISLSVVILLASSANATTYKYQDQDGRTVYAQHPPATGPYTVIDTPKSNKYGASSQPAATKSSSKPSLKDRVGKITGRRWRFTLVSNSQTTAKIYRLQDYIFRNQSVRQRENSFQRIDKRH